MKHNLTLSEDEYIMFVFLIGVAQNSDTNYFSAFLELQERWGWEFLTDLENEFHTLILDHGMGDLWKKVQKIVSAKDE